MKLFTVAIQKQELAPHELEIALRSFAHLTAKVTPKHRKTLRLRLVEDHQQQPLVNRLLQRFDLTNYVEWISPVEAELTGCQVLFFPTLQPEEHLIQESLGAGVPVLTYDNSVSEQYIDSSCGLLVPYRSGERAAQVFSDYLRMLYFDPEAQRFLQKGALKRSQRYPIPMSTAALSMAS